MEYTLITNLLHGGLAYHHLGYTFCIYITSAQVGRLSPFSGPIGNPTTHQQLGGKGKGSLHYRIAEEMKFKVNVSLSGNLALSILFFLAHPGILLLLAPSPVLSQPVFSLALLSCPLLYLFFLPSQFLYLFNTEQCGYFIFGLVSCRHNEDLLFLSES